MSDLFDYLYLEAVNLGGVIDDTEDLSTRRAGGYMLLELVHQVKEGCAARLSPVSIGASQGLFKLIPGQDMAEARQAVMAVLKRPLYAQATVLVADTVVERRPEPFGKDDFSAVCEYLRAVVRRRQLSALGCVTAFGPPPNTSVADKPKFKLVCEVDAVRPASELRPFKTEDDWRWQSESVTLRRDEGVQLRQDFYQRELKGFTEALAIIKDEFFTDHFDELSSFGYSEQGTLRPVLHHKIAVFYADGDSFGKLAGACKTPEALTAWDALVQSQRRNFLAAMVTLLDKHPHGRNGERRNQRDNPKKPGLRVETLMWGGDEFRLVLPAWLGFEVAQLFFDTCNIDWPDCTCKVAEPDCTGTGTCTCACAPIRRGHSAALVFAHHNAPISQLDKLSKVLAEQGKDKDSSYKGMDSLHWITLESFDHAGTAVHDDGQAWWGQRGLPQLNWGCMALNPTRIKSLMAHLPTIAGQLPRRNVYRMLDLLPRWDLASGDEIRLVQGSYDNLHAATATLEHRRAWRECWKALQPRVDLDWPDVVDLPDDFAKAGHLNAWLTLAELWDYLLPNLAEPVPASETDKPSAGTATPAQGAA